MKKIFTNSILIVFILCSFGKYSFSQPPAYDNCVTAISLPFHVKANSNCTGVIDFTNDMATPTPAGVIPVPSCGTFTDGTTPDVWFKFTANNFTSYRINVDPGTPLSASDLAIAVYTGGCNGPWNLLACNDNGAAMPVLTMFSATSGTEYFIRLWSNDGTTPGNFRICVVVNLDVSTEDMFLETVEVSPNPFSDRLQIRLPIEINNSSVKIFNPLGEVVLSESDNEALMNLNTDFLKKGIYFLKIETDMNSISRRIVKM